MEGITTVLANYYHTLNSLVGGNNNRSFAQGVFFLRSVLSTTVILLILFIYHIILVGFTLFTLPRLFARESFLLAIQNQSTLKCFEHKF